MMKLGDNSYLITLTSESSPSEDLTPTEKSQAWAFWNNSRKEPYCVGSENGNFSIMVESFCYPRGSEIPKVSVPFIKKWCEPEDKFIFIKAIPFNKDIDTSHRLMSGTKVVLTLANQKYNLKKAEVLYYDNLKKRYIIRVENDKIISVTYDSMEKMSSETESTQDFPPLSDNDSDPVVIVKPMSFSLLFDDDNARISPHIKESRVDRLLHVLKREWESMSGDEKANLIIGFDKFFVKEESMVGESMVGESVVEKSMVGESMVGESVVEKSMVEGSMVEESMVEQ